MGEAGDWEGLLNRVGLAHAPDLTIAFSGARDPSRHVLPISHAAPLMRSVSFHDAGRRPRG